MSATRRELRERRERQDQFTRQQRGERAIAERTDVGREAVTTREIANRPSVKESAVRRSVAQEAGEDFSPADVRIIERDGQTIGGSVKDSAKRREVVQDVLGQVGEDFSAEDVAVRKTDTGSFEAEIKTAAAKREAAESVLENAPEGFTREDVAFSRSDDGIQARISESAIERKRQQQRQELRKRTAGQSAVLDSEDITISETKDGLRAEPKEGALRESLREKFSSNVDGVDPSDVTVSREDGQLVAKPTEQTRRRLIKEQVAEQRSFVDRDEVTVDLSGEDPDVTIRGGDRPKSVPEGADPGQDVDLPAGVPGDVVGSRQAAFAQFDTSLPAGLDKQDIREGDISAQRLVGIAGNLGTIPRQYNPAIGFRGKTKVRPADVGERQSDLPSATELASESDLSPAEVREAGELFRVKTAGGGIEAAGRTREAALRELGERAFEQSVDKLGSAAFTNEKLATVGIDREAAIKRQTRQRVLEQVPEDVKAGDIDVDIQNGQPTARVTSAARKDIRQAQRQSVKQQVAQRAGEGITTADVDVQRDDGQVTGRVEVSALRRETAEAAGERFKLRDVTVQSGAQGTLAFIGGAAVEREQAEIRRQAAQKLSQDFGRQNVKEFDRTDIVAGSSGRLSVSEKARDRALINTAAATDGAVPSGSAVFERRSAIETAAIQKPQTSQRRQRGLNVKVDFSDDRLGSTDPLGLKQFVEEAPSRILRTPEQVGVSNFKENVDRRVEARKNADQSNDLGNQFGLSRRNEARLAESTKRIGSFVETGAETISPVATVGADFVTAPTDAATTAAFGGDRLGDPGVFGASRRIFNREEGAISRTNETKLEKQAETVAGGITTALATAPTGATTAANELFETGRFAVEGEPSAGERAGAVGAAGARVVKNLAGAAKRDPLRFTAEVVGGLPLEVASARLAGKGIRGVRRRAQPVTQPVSDRVRTAGAKTVDVEDVTTAEVAEFERIRREEGAREAFKAKARRGDVERFPSAVDEDLFAKSQKRSIQKTSRQTVASDIETFIDEVAPGSQSRDATLFKALSEEPTGPKRASRTAEGFKAPEAGTAKAETFETPGSSVGPALSPNFLRLGKRIEAAESPKLGLRPGLPSIGRAVRPSGLITRLDIRDTEAANVREFSRELRQADDADARTLPPDEATPAESEAVVPPGTELADPGGSVVRNLARRAGVGADLAVEIGDRRVPLRVALRKSDLDDASLGELLRRKERGQLGGRRDRGSTEGQILERVTRPEVSRRRGDPDPPVDRPTPLTTGPSGPSEPTSEPSDSSAPPDSPPLSGTESSPEVRRELDGSAPTSGGPAESFEELSEPPAGSAGSELSPSGGPSRPVDLPGSSTTPPGGPGDSIIPPGSPGGESFTGSAPAAESAVGGTNKALDPSRGRVSPDVGGNDEDEFEEPVLSLESGFSKEISSPVADVDTVLSGDVGDLGDPESFSEASEEPVGEFGPAVSGAENADIDDLEDIDL